MGGRAARRVDPQPPMSEAEVIDELDDVPEGDSREPRFTDDDDRPYERQGRRDFMSGRTYALLEATGRDWKIITRPAGEFDLFADDPLDRFGMGKPTLSWAKDGKAVHIYVDGMTTQAFLDEMRFALELDNTTTTSKRLSRILRPQAATAWFDADEVSISHDLSQPKFRRLPDLANPGKTVVRWGTGRGDELPAEVVETVWDGAGVVSRDMLVKMIDRLPADMDPRMRAKTVRELLHARRVEFTIMTADGQLKGHAMVSENLSTDFVVPKDLKTQVTLTDPSRRYVAFEFPHGQDHMRLDVQSLVNLHPFFEEDRLIQWLQDDFRVFEESVRTGDIAAGMAKIDRNTTIEDLQQWALREFAASGGDINWSGSFVKSYMNSYLKRVQSLTDPESKLRLPIPGGRYYVMPSMVGRRANMPVQVERGDVFIDPDTGTAWVNDQDWIELQDGASYGDSSVPMTKRWGIGRILGGADHDDGLWVHPFADHDGEQKMLIWRSPNEAGEYVILRPSETSSDLPWQTVDGDVRYPDADSRNLPTRADRRTIHDRGLIDDNPQVNDLDGISSDEPTPLYDAMRQAARREATNAALLGSVCNYQLVYKAVYGVAPPERPAPLEVVIDLKKTGADGSEVSEYIWLKRLQLLQSRVPIPRLLADRVSTSQQQAVLTDGSHWMDKIETAINDHTRRVQIIRDEMVRETRPPQALFDYAFERPDLVAAGGRLNQVYANAVRVQRQMAWWDRRDVDWEAARARVRQELEKIPPDEQGRVLVGSIASVYMAKDPGNDGVAWLMGAMNEQGLREAGFAQKTMQEMRQIGLLSHLLPDPTGRGLIQYQLPQRQTASQTIGINGIWRNMFQMMAEQTDQPDYDEWDTSTGEGRAARRQFATKAKQLVQRFMGDTDHLDLEVRDEEWKGTTRKVVYSVRTGRKFGTIDRVDADRYQAGQQIRISASLVKDGNIRAIAQRTD